MANKVKLPKKQRSNNDVNSGSDSQLNLNKIVASVSGDNHEIGTSNIEPRSRRNVPL